MGNSSLGLSLQSMKKTKQSLKHIKGSTFSGREVVPSSPQSDEHRADVRGLLRRDTERFKHLQRRGGHGTTVLL